MNYELQHEPRIASHRINNSASAWLMTKVHELAGKIPGLSTHEQFTHARSILDDLQAHDQSLATTYKKLLSIEIDALFLSGLPVFNDASAEVNNRVLSMILGCFFGEVFQYQQQHKGKLIPALVPKAHSSTNTNSTTKSFEAHSDDAFIPHQYRVQYISLLGERNDSKAATGYSSISDIIQQLTTKQVEILSSNWFKFRLPVSFSDENFTKTTSDSQPIIFKLPCGNIGVQCPTYSTQICKNANYQEAVEALNAFKKAVNNVMQWKIIEQSTYLVFSNNRGLHAREPITSGAESRKIYRAYWHDNLNLLREAVDTRNNVFDLSCLLSSFEQNERSQNTQ